MSARKKQAAVLSIDLAHKRYAYNGLALLAGGKPDVAIVKPCELGLADPPAPGKFADALDAFCTQRAISVLLIDGPQAWRFPGSQIPHMRLCERVLNTPGKTGNEASAKPGTYLPFIQFSIELFTHLRLQHGWRLLHEGWQELPRAKWVVETFPSAAWRTLGLPKLPAKPRTTTRQLAAARHALSDVTGLRIPSEITHDELQAVVCLPAGRAIAARNPSKVFLAGVDPIPGPKGIVLEGHIVLPLL